MQTGAIFARGSCSALKWMALFGVVFALGTGSAVAQPAMTLSVPDKYELTEGGSLTVTIKASIARVAGAAATSVTVEVEGDNDTAATPPDDAEPAQDFTISPGVVTLRWEAVGSRAPRDAVEASATVTIRANSDNDAEDETSTLTFTPDSTTTLIATTAQTKSFTIKDSDTQKYGVALDPGEVAKEGGEFDLTIRADPLHEDDGTELRIFLSHPDYEVLDGSRVTIGNYDHDDDTGTANALVNTAGITIKAPADDKNREADALVIRVFGTESSNLDYS